MLDLATRPVGHSRAKLQLSGGLRVERSPRELRLSRGTSEAVDS
jgi:hypothetical protein